jgi:hypothetical protein
MARGATPSTARWSFRVLAVVIAAAGTCVAALTYALAPILWPEPTIFGCFGKAGFPLFRLTEHQFSAEGADRHVWPITIVKGESPDLYFFQVKAGPSPISKSRTGFAAAETPSVIQIEAEDDLGRSSLEYIRKIPCPR